LTGPFTSEKTTTLTLPGAAPGGVSQVSSVAESTATLVAGLLPMVTLTVPLKRVPVMVIF
jgi:hypothetical protein